jgi:hypothetical protein
MVPFKLGVCEIFIQQAKNRKIFRMFLPHRFNQNIGKHGLNVTVSENSQQAISSQAKVAEEKTKKKQNLFANLWHVHLTNMQ